MKTEQINLERLLPLFLCRDPSAKAMIAALNPQLQELAAKIDLAFIYLRIDPPPGSNLIPLDEPMLDELAWAFHVDFYDVGADIFRKRDIVKTAIRIHQKKGTPAAVEEAMTIAFADSTLEEWFEYGGDPFTFRITTDATLSSLDDLGRFLKALTAAKNVRSHLSEIKINARSVLNQYSGVGVFSYRFTNVEVEAPAIAWSDFDTYDKTWAQWDALNLTWIEFTLYTE